MRNLVGEGFKKKSIRRKTSDLTKLVYLIFKINSLVTWFFDLHTFMLRVCIYKDL